MWGMEEKTHNLLKCQYIVMGDFKMEEREKVLSNSCDFREVAPIMVDLPYPPIQIQEKNKEYAALLSNDYAGAVSEMSAIIQDINHENNMACERCPVAKTILGIAMAEMIHLQKLAELIFLLGGSIDFVARQRNGRNVMWTPQNIVVSPNTREMLLADVEGEKAAICQYKAHSKLINDSGINAVLDRIIQDEEYHIMILQTLLKEL